MTNLKQIPERHTATKHLQGNADLSKSESRILLTLCSSANPYLQLLSASLHPKHERNVNALMLIWGITHLLYLTVCRLFARQHQFVLTWIDESHYQNWGSKTELLLVLVHFFNRNPPRLSACIPHWQSGRITIQPEFFCHCHPTPAPTSKSCKAQSFHQTWFHDRWIAFPSQTNP